jgi:hypothetical protein
LVPEPTNEFDPEAIRVESVGGAHVGYVPADATRRIRKVMKDQPVHAAFWAQHLTRRGQVVALEVMVWRPGRIDGLHEVPLHQEWSTPS